MQTGTFTNAANTYYAAPQQLNGGQIIGHNHVVVEEIASLDSTQPTNPRVFAFFKGLNAPAANGKLTADLPKGLPAGTYRLSSISSAANHQSVVMPVAQRGAVDDAVYVRLFPLLCDVFLTSARPSSLPLVVMPTMATEETVARTTMVRTVAIREETAARTVVKMVQTAVRTTMVRTVLVIKTAATVVVTADAMVGATRGVSSHGTKWLDSGVVARPLSFFPIP